jgi:uncharacterized protein with HEPN domain
MPPDPDRIRLTHMLEATAEALRFATGRSRNDLEADAMLRRALLHCIQEIGEAASGVSDKTRRVLPDIPWMQIVGMRHRLVHVYFDVNLDLVWEVLKKDLPPLELALQHALE